MVDPTARDLIRRMADELDHYRQLLSDDRREAHALATEARAALAQQPPPAANERIKPLNTDMDAARWASEFVKLHGGDENLMCVWFANTLMCGWINHYWTTPEYKASIDRALGQPAPPAEGEVAELAAALGVMAVDAEVADKIWEMKILDRAAALLQQHPEPVPVSERLPDPRPESEGGDCDAEGRCWWRNTDGGRISWELTTTDEGWAYWLPAHALPLPTITTEKTYD